MIRNLNLLAALVLVARLGAQDLFVYGAVQDLPDSLPIENAEITVFDERDLAVDATTTGDSGYYEFGLALDAMYRIEYAAPGAIPKALLIDTRNVDATPEEMEGGWGMSINISVCPWIEGVPDSLIAMPFGKASWSPADTSFRWDLAYTGRVREAWAPWTARIGDARVPRPKETWDLRLSVLVLLTLLMFFWSGYFSVRLDAWAKSLPDARPHPLVLVLTIAVLGSLAWFGWRVPGWPGWWAAMSATLAISGLVMLLSKLKYLIDVGDGDERLAAEHERARGQHILSGTRFLGGVLSILCAFVLSHSKDLTLFPERDFLRHAAYGVVIVIVISLLFGRAIKRVLVLRWYRLTFSSLVAFLAMLLVPTAVYLIDRGFAEASTSRLVQITGLHEHRRMRSATTWYTARVLIDGRFKDLGLAPDEWPTTSDLDAMDLRIGQGPFGIDHILDWRVVPRAQQGLKDSVATH